MHLFDFSLCVFKRTFKELAFVWLFSTVCFSTNLQRACLRGCKVTLVAFVCDSSSAYFQMNPQMTCKRRFIITLIAFVWLFSNIFVQLGPQIACISKCIVTLVAFAWLFFNDHYVHSSEPPKSLPERKHNHIGCISLTFLRYVCSNVPSIGPPETRCINTGCICEPSYHH